MSTSNSEDSTEEEDEQLWASNPSSLIHLGASKTKPPHSKELTNRESIRGIYSAMVNLVDQINAWSTTLYDVEDLLFKSQYILVAKSFKPGNKNMEFVEGLSQFYHRSVW